MPRLPHFAALLLAAAATAQAGEHRAYAAAPAVVLQECGSCHVVYPAALLPAESWRALMAGLPRHFGSDASVDANTARAIGTWYEANAGSGKRAREVPPEHRITRGAWFLREHREVSAATWKTAAVKSPANCSACHVGAAQGDFDEHAVRIPR